MTNRIIENRLEVQRALEAAMSCADVSESRSLFEVERELWTLMLQLGRALITLFLARQAARPNAADYEHDGRRYGLYGEKRSTKIGTRFGRVPFVRPVGRQVGNTKAKADLPVDRQLGLCGGFSLGTVTAYARLAAMMAFAQARSTFQQFHEWTPSPRAALRMVDAVGAEARPFVEQAPAPADDGDILVIEVDGRGAPMISPTERERRTGTRSKRKGTRRARKLAQRRAYPRRRRRKGDKSKNAKVAVLGVIYTLRKTKDGLEGPINKRVIGTFEGHRVLMQMLRAEADKRGYGKKPCVFLGDGSEHIWREKKTFFSDAEGGLDWIHVVEKVWEAGRFVFREGSTGLANWVDSQKALLRMGKVWDVIANLRNLRRRVRETETGKKKRKRLDDIVIHFGDHAEHMRYHSLRKRGLPIATGAVEGAVRNVVAVRLDGPGMRWGRERSELVLQLRCILVSGQWNEFIAYLAKRNGVTLRGQPIQATPYKAAA